MFDHISKRFEVCEKYSAARRIFNSPFSAFGNVVKHGVSSGSMFEKITSVRFVLFSCVVDLACCEAYSGHWVTHSWYDQVSVHSLMLYTFVRE